MNKAPGAIQNWAKKIVEENLAAAKDEGAREKVIYKVGHTQMVVDMGREIMLNIPEFEWNETQVEVICFLHDIGRFPQVLKNSYSDLQTGIDHASLGAKMIAEENFPWEEWGLKGNEIIEAVKWHNQKEYLGENIYAKLIRDADKNALFLDFEVMARVAREEKKLGNKIKPEIWGKLERRETLGHELTKSNSEWAINVATWLWDLNFAYSKKIAAKSGVIEKIIKVFVDNGNSEEEILKMKKYLEEFKLQA